MASITQNCHLFPIRSWPLRALLGGGEEQLTVPRFKAICSSGGWVSCTGKWPVL